MTNLIPQLNLTQLASMLAEDKLMTGVMKNVPESLLTGLMPHQNILVKIVINNDLLTTKQPFEAVLKTPEGEEVALKMNLDKPLLLPKEAEGKAELKIVSPLKGEIKVKLLTIDGENPEKFIVSEKSDVVVKSAIQTSKLSTLEQNVKNETAPIIKTLGALPDKSEVVSTVKFEKIFEAVKTELSQIVQKMPMKEAQEVTKFLNSDFVKALPKELGNLEFKLAVKEIPTQEPIVKTSVLETKNEPVLKLVEQIQKNLPKLLEFVENKENVSKNLLLALPKLKQEMTVLQEAPLLAKVEKVLENNNFVLKTGLGELLLKSDLKLPLGKEIFLKLEDFIFAKSENSDLKSSFESVLKLVQPKFEHLIAEKLPNLAQPRAVVNLVTFVKAVVHQDLKIWLGNEAVEILSQSGAEGKEAVSQLQNLLSSSVKESPNWRFVEVPFMLDSGFSKFKVALKKQKDDERSAKHGKKGSRFIIDTNFSIMGEIQFDGYAVAKERRFDLIMRTEKEFASDIYANIIKLFKISLNELEYSGNIKINAKENFVKISDDIAMFTDGVYI
ncbi:MAG: hypothetical protein PHE89_05160 [Alphaproteobacteria bacterium]|nr:hypothetical protein [Alphaproteobacteria bacterium]